MKSTTRQSKKVGYKKKDNVLITKYTFHYLIHYLILPALVKKMSTTHHTNQLDFLFSICKKVGIDKTIIDNWLREKQTFSYDIRLTRLFVNGNWELFKDHFETVDAAVADLCPVPSNSLMESLLLELKEGALNFRKRNHDAISSSSSAATTATIAPVATVAEEEPSSKRQAIEMSLLHPADCPLPTIDLTKSDPELSPLSPLLSMLAVDMDGKKDEDIEDDNDSSSDFTGSTTSSATKKKQKKLKLPYTGGIDLNCCQAISLNYNTYVQCRGKLSKKKMKTDEMAAVDPSFPNKICNACFNVYKKKTHFIGFIEDRETIIRGKTVVKFNDEFLQKHFPTITMEDVANEAIAKNKYYDPDWGVSTSLLIFGEEDDDDDDDDSGDEEVLEKGEC